MFFKYPSPEAYASPSPARGEGSGLLRRCTPRNDAVTNGKGLPRPWCHKILGTRPSMTGARGTYSFGRSMIEMLGVLAIIAVLSVGGIAGYSKAMEKWKMDKLVEDYSYLISGLLEHKSSLTPLSSDSSPYIISDVIEGMNLLPGNWKKSGSTLIDSAGNSAVPFIRSNIINVDIYLGHGKSISNKYVSETFSSKMCTSLLNDLFQPLHSIIRMAGVYRNDGKGTYFYGDKYCTYQKCLVEATMTEIQNVCNCQLNNDYCIFLVEFD